MFTVNYKTGTSKKGNAYAVLIISVKGVEIAQKFLEDKDVKLIELLKQEEVKKK